jgi:NADPH-dependent glutamate synthase beta subunit-like oxidoreductase
MVEGRTYRPVIQSDRCQTCQICISGCPAEVFPEYRKEDASLRGILYGKKISNKIKSGKNPLPPCQEACPIHQDTRGYVKLIADGKFEEALALIREVNPLPAVCGLICHHPCEEACLRQGLDGQVRLRLLKQFAAQYRQKKVLAGKNFLKKNGNKVLVIGSGPAGLTAANDLSLLGYKVTIFEALPVLGGMLAVGIPEFRLPKKILNMEIDLIKELGVEMKVLHPFYLSKDGKTLKDYGFQAAFFSIGTHQSLRLKIPGETFQGVFSGVEFLREVNLGRRLTIGKRVAVIGGGNVAVDAARSALRQGAEKVEIYYRRSRREMPAISEEVDEAVHEGVKIHFLSSPLKIIGKSGRVTEMECVGMKLVESDGEGRRKPVPIDGSSYRVPVDSIITAVGQGTDRNALKGLDVNQDGTVRIDPETGETSMKGVFAGGDVVTGPGWAIDAICAGKKGAESIHRYLNKNRYAGQNGKRR